MNRLTIIIILLVLIPISVEALYVKDENGKTKNCVDKSKQEWHNYVIKYEHPSYPDMGPDSYVVVDSTGYPKPMHVEKGISQYGYDKDYTSTEYSTKFNQYREQYRLTEPEGKHLYTRYMGWVPFNLNDAAFDMAYQQFIYEYFVPTDDCIPCTERGLTEYYGECVTCSDWSENFPVFSYDPNQVVQGKKGYYGCFPCPEGTKWDGKECSDPTTTPTPTTTASPTKTPTPTTTTPPTTTPAPKRCPDHMEWDGSKCVERCPSTSLDDYKAWDPELKKCVDPADCMLTKPDHPPPTSNGCGSGWNEKFVPDSFPPFNPFGLGFSFSSACDAHDICYGTCNAGHDACDNQFLTNMRSECDSWINRAKSQGIFSWLPDSLFALNKAACNKIANFYYGGVQQLGGSAYKDAQDEFCIDKCTSPK